MVETFLNLGRSIVNAPEFDGYSNLTDSSFFKVPDAKPLTRKHLEDHLFSFLESYNYFVLLFFLKITKVISSGFCIPSSHLSDNSINESLIPDADFDPFSLIQSFTAG